MKKTPILFSLLGLFSFQTFAQKPLFMPQNIKKAFDNQTRSMDGKPGPKYWQNKAKYDISIAMTPPSKRVTGTETIVYYNQSPSALSVLTLKLILNIHKPGAGRQSPTSADYLTEGIIIDKYTEAGKDKKLPSAGASTVQSIRLSNKLESGDSLKVTFDWHYDLSEESGREGKLDSTSYHLAYFYPRIAVYDDVHGWDRMGFTDSQEFYNDFNDYQVAVTVPKNYIVWGTGDLLNPQEVLQTKTLDRYLQSFKADSVIHVVTKQDLYAQNVTNQAETNTWKWKANHITDMAYCISNQYIWDATSAVIDSTTGRRASCQSAYKPKGSGKFLNQAKHIQHSLNYFSHQWPGVAYPFPKSTIIQGFADMEYPMMANDSPQGDDTFQRFVAEHEIAHSYFPFYMGINEHRYGFMDEGWTTAFENMIATTDMGKTKADDFFKQFRVNSWAKSPTDESQIPIITPTNILSGASMGNNEYGKPALAYLAIKDMLGDELFKKTLHGFMDRWHGKHPIPWDMFNSFSDVSGMDMTWFWDNWFFSNGYMDIAIESVVPKKKNQMISIKNIGGYAVPFDITIQYEDKTTETLHKSAMVWKENQTILTLDMPTKKKIVYAKLNNGIYVDANEKDNIFGEMLK